MRPRGGVHACARASLRRWRPGRARARDARGRAPHASRRRLAARAPVRGPHSAGAAIGASTSARPAHARTRHQRV